MDVRPALGTRTELTSMRPGSPLTADGVRSHDMPECPPARFAHIASDRRLAPGAVLSTNNGWQLWAESGG